MQQIDVYQTDANGIFIHTDKANELALSPGTFNIPYGAKLTAPPDIPQGKAAVAAGDSWILLDDNRSEIFYRVDSGEQYVFNTAIAVANAVVIYTGVGAVPAWLTSVVPSPESPPVT